MISTFNGKINNHALKLTSRIFFYIFCTFIFGQCKTNKEQHKKNPILLANREAPLGWVYLRIYEDGTFEFESRGLEIEGDIYSGKVKITTDTLFFNYVDSIPGAGKTAIYNSTGIAYIDGQYPESMSITMNKISR